MMVVQMRQWIFIISLALTACSTPKAVFTVVQHEKSAPSHVDFQNNSTKATTFWWDFGDGNTSDEANPRHKYILSGKYKVSLKAMNQDKSNVAIHEIVVDAPHRCLVELSTSEGNMTIELYDETPLHRDNFIKLAEEGFYEGVLFHRVIKGFMIQGGDPFTKNGKNVHKAGVDKANYLIPAEFNPYLVHTKGALAAARTGDHVNPKKESSGSQFYIVQGKTLTVSQIENFELQKGIKYSEKDKEIMKTLGATPQLDQEYTVFGRVVKGLDIIDKIANHATDQADKPLQDVKILYIKIIK